MIMIVVVITIMSAVRGKEFSHNGGDSDEDDDYCVSNCAC